LLSGKWTGRKCITPTNCPLVSVSNVDQELSWTREEYEKIGVKYRFRRSRPENDWYPQHIDNRDNLIRFGGLFPPIHVHADIRKTGLLRRNKAGRSGMSNYDHRVALRVDFS
jgi:hypothetical protein